MKTKYLETAFNNSLIKVEDLCVQALNLIRLVRDIEDGINFLDFSGTGAIYSWGDRKRLRKVLTDLELELYRIRLILKEQTEKDPFRLNLEQLLAQREEGDYLKSLKGWKRKQLKRIQFEIFDLFKFIKRGRINNKYG